MVALVVAVASFPARAETATEVRAVPPPTGDELLLEIDVNDQRLNETALLLRTPDHRFWATAGDLRKWRLRVPAASSQRHGGEDFYPLEAISGIDLAFDAPRQRLVIRAPAEAFAESVVSTERPPYPAAATPIPGAFVNYGATALRAGGVSDYAAQVEAGLFSRYGVLVASALAQDSDGERKLTRLDTTYTLDFPDALQTLRAGDAVTTAGAWGRAVRIGGVQFGTNFGLQPGFVAYPSIAANGQAALPSTVDVFVNNALVAQRSVPPGPFSMTNIPTVTGGGNVELVVRDLLGRETVITQPFYSSTQLLAPGLSEFSVEAGFERGNYGTASADYGRAVGAATYRHGFTDHFTAEVRGEVLRDQGAAGVAAAYLAPSIGVFDGTIAVSGARGSGTGVLAGAGFEKESGRAGFAIHTQWASDEFRISGVVPENPIPRLQIAANAGYQSDRWGSINLVYVSQRFRSLTDVQVASAVYTVQVARQATLAFSVLKSFAGDHATTLSASISVPFGDSVSASLTQLRRRGDAVTEPNQTQFTLQRNLPVGEGYGYRLYGQSPNEVQASFALQRNYGTYVAEVARFGGETATRFTATGGIGMLGGHVFASREITESFGVVRVDDYAGVGVLLDNQLAGRTDDAGYAVLTPLRAYDINRVSIDLRDLPLDAQVDRLRIDAVPYYRSGVLAEFPVRRSHGATFTVRLDDGSALPAGATMSFVGRGEEFPVGLEGKVYMTGLAHANRIRGDWRGQRCEFDVRYAPTDDPLPDLGNFVCTGVAQ